MSKQILNGMISRRGMGFDRDAVTRAQEIEIERGKNCDHRSGGCLMPADFAVVGIGAHMIRVMNNERREPQDTPLNFVQRGKCLLVRRIIQLSLRICKSLVLPRLRGKHYSEFPRRLM